MMIEDRGSVGMGELQKGAQLILSKAASNQSLQGVTTTFNAEVRNSTSISTARWWSRSASSINDIFQTLQTYLGSTYINLFNKFNQSFQVRVQAKPTIAARSKTFQDLYVANRDGQMVPLGTMINVHRDARDRNC